MSLEILDENIEESNNHNYAGFWARFGASFLDGIIMLPLGLAYLLILVDINFVAISLATSLIATLYKPYLEGKYGATWGKMAVGIKVLKTDGTDISFNESFKRFALPWGYAGVISIIMMYNVHAAAATLENGVGFMEFAQLSSQQPAIISSLSSVSNLLYLVFGLSIAFEKTKRGIHDKIGGTIVVYK